MAFRNHQVFAREWLRSHPKGILAMQQRTGKTPLALLDLAPPANILCPAFLKGQWLRECAQWRPELRATILRPGDSAKRIGGDIFITNYEILQDTNIAACPHLIVDEGHYCSGWESKRTITTLALAKHADRVRWMTGTLMPNRSMEFWAPMKAVGATELDAISFGERYAGGWEDRWGTWHFRDNTNTAELKAKLRPFLLRITREQIGMPEAQWRVVALDLPIDVRERAYSLDAIKAARDPLQLEGLAELLHTQGRAKAPLVIGYVADILRETKPVLLFLWHQDVVDTCTMALRAKGFRVASIDGRVPPGPKRDAIVAEYQRGELDVIVANRKSAGVGLPLHAAQHVIFGEGAWNHADMEQPADRSISMDKPESVPVDILTVFGSIDDVMVRRALEKQGVHDSIVEPSEEFEQWQQKVNRQHNPPPSNLSCLRLPRPKLLSPP